MRDGRWVTVEVTADGVGLVSGVGGALLGQVADRVGLPRALSSIWLRSSSVVVVMTGGG